MVLPAESTLIQARAAFTLHKSRTLHIEERFTKFEQDMLLKPHGFWRHSVLFHKPFYAVLNSAGERKPWV